MILKTENFQEKVYDLDCLNESKDQFNRLNQKTQRKSLDCYENSQSCDESGPRSEFHNYQNVVYSLSSLEACCL